MNHTVGGAHAVTNQAANPSARHNRESIPLDVFESVRLPFPPEPEISSYTGRTGDGSNNLFTQCSNPRLTEEFIDRIAIIGGGRYGTAIGDLLSLAGNPVAIYARKPEVARDIMQHHRNVACLGDRPLDKNLQASSSRGAALLDRGIVILAVPTMALEEQINSLRPHPDSIVVSLAKGLIIKGWKPDTKKHDYSKGPPPGAEVYLPLEFMRQHPNFEDVKSLCMVSGPGFADELRDGRALDLSVAVNYECPRTSDSEKRRKLVSQHVAAHVANKFNSAGITTELTHDFIGVQIAAAMKNVISVMVGVCDGLCKMHGENAFHQNLREKIMRYGMQEAANIIKWKGGKPRTIIDPCGYPDLHLSTSSTTGRNYSLGLSLADGSRVDKVIGASNTVVEGAVAAWGIKLLTDDKPGKPGIYTPITNALIDIFGGQNLPSVVVERLLSDLSKVSMNEVHLWQSRQGRVQE